MCLALEDVSLKTRLQSIYNITDLFYNSITKHSRSIYKHFLSTTVVFMLKCFYMHPTGAHLHPNANKYPATWVMTHNLPCHGSQTRPCFHLMTIITSQKVMAPIPGQKCAKKTSQTHENDQATIKTRYCGHLYSPLLRKWTYWSQRGWVSYCMREG